MFNNITSFIPTLSPPEVSTCTVAAFSIVLNLLINPCILTLMVIKKGATEGNLVGG